MGVRCFLIEPTGMSRRYLRRYSKQHAENQCAGKHSYHQAWAAIDDMPTLYSEEKDERTGRRYILGNPDKVEDFVGDPRWPVKCACCNYQFAPGDEWQVFSDQIYRRGDTGEEKPFRDWHRVPGAMWDAWWYPVKGADGKSLMVICPDGRQWLIDSRASNCTMKDDEVHRCWIRHGTPPLITVDKNGQTCAAGGGSIDTGTYHGFLRNGEFTAC